MQRDTPEIEAARLELRIAQMKLEAALLKAPSEVKGCDLAECAGPSMGGCPMGYAGSCRSHGR